MEPQPLPLPRIRLVLASRQPVLREGIRELLRPRNEIEVLAEFVNVILGVEACFLNRADILLADVSLSEPADMRHILDALGTLATTRLMLLTDCGTAPEVPHLLTAGVRGVLLKETVTSAILVSAIGAVMAGDRWFGKDSLSAVPVRRRRFRNAIGVPLPFGLTPREIEILRLVAGGYANGQIAQLLSISVQTVKHHVRNVFDKTGVDTRLELALFAHHHQLLAQNRGEARPGPARLFREAECELPASA